MSPTPYRLGCDIGGTFTDFVLVNDDTGELLVHKCLTTPADPSEAVEQGVLALAERVPGLPKLLREIVHGTTLVINAIIERKGSRTALITTRGFRDTLELGREKRYDTYDVFAEMAPPLVERSLRVELDERIAADGRVLKTLDPAQVRELLAELRGKKVDSIAVCLINSFENPVHELQVKEVLEREAPDIAVSISYDVLPQIREYERTSTTVANAYVKPLTARYLARLKQRLETLGFGGQIYMMLSSGGITSVDAARQSPVRVIESGPTAAVISAEYFGRMLGIQELFAYDMGGTTAKSCLIQKGRAGKVTTFEVGRVHRFKKGSGIPIQVPVVDLMEIGAGGGSIARVSKLGLLQVGPDSASAVPGPAGYGRGGIEPTVSDADLVLGYLDPDYFLGGNLKLHRDLAEDAIRKRIAEPLGMSVTDAAWGIHDIINETMAAAAKTHIAEKGGNPRQVTVAAFGGAGPVHACSLARKLKAQRVLVPPVAGVGSALGFFTAPVAYEVVRTRKMNLPDAKLLEIESLFREMEASGREVVAPAGHGDLLYERSIDMRLAGQGCELSVALPTGDVGAMTQEAIRALFDTAYTELYGRTYPEVPVELITFNTVVRLPSRPLQLPKVEKSAHGAEGAVKGARMAYSPDSHDYVRHVVYDRYKLGTGDTLTGPAIIEERESTTIVGERAKVTVNEYGFLFIDLETA